ncbi:SafA/ExsA family spore coat assembly protein [Virgibacillus proomii]|uniref:SafA/ExsA family spore coat assembly protein n=1 Tax=Virgibacillus proomii TaxID=84407 RepID=UPI00118007D3|nr:SafA/ExsA family spore coat assembly protein [Virgibacillus proomii]
MKIHIVQKGDTMWEIAQQYGVDFEELKQLNSQISSPDMIMPGMKIKIPGSSKAVKQKQQMKPKEKPMHPYKEMKTKPMPVIKEDDKKKPKMPKPKMPMPSMPAMPVQPIMQMPVMEQEFQNYTTINFPQMPAKPEHKVKHVKKEKPKKEKVKEKPMPKPMPMPHVPMVPLCCYVMDPCYPQIPFQMMAPLPYHSVGMYPMPHYDHHGHHHHHMHHGLHDHHYEHHHDYGSHVDHHGSMMDWDDDCGCDDTMQWGSPSMYRSQEEEASAQPVGYEWQTPTHMYPPFAYGATYPMPPGFTSSSHSNSEQQSDNEQQSE